MNVQHHQIFVIVWLPVRTLMEDMIVIVSLVLNWMLLIATHALVSINNNLHAI